MPEDEGADALLDERTGGVGQPRLAALPWPEHVEAEALSLVLPAVEGGMVDDHGPAGGTDAAGFLGEREPCERDGGRVGHPGS